MELLPAYATEIGILLCAFIGIAFSLFLLHESHNTGGIELLSMDDRQARQAAQKAEDEYIRIRKDVSEGVTAFLFMECRRIAILMLCFAMPIFLLLGYVGRFNSHSRPCDFYPSNMCKPFAIAVSFLLGALTSAFSDFLGMNIALYANAWTDLNEENGPFRAALRNGAAMGFRLASVGLLGLNIAIITFKLCYGNDWEGLFGVITSYGLGASSMAFFGRTGGGIYAKAADVCYHLVNYHPSIRPLEDTVITYNVGDIVGDIAGTGTDLFGSYTQSSCAALVVASISSFGIDHDFTAMCYPLLLSSMGILVCLITTLLVTNFLEITGMEEIKRALKNQLIISTILMTVGIALVSWLALPLSFTIYSFGLQKVVKSWQVSLCVGVGLWAGSIAELLPRSYTIGAIRSLRDAIAKKGAGILVSGSAVLCCSIPLYAGISIDVNFNCAATYGIALAALGMLSTIPIRMAIDAYDPIGHYANRIAQMAHGNYRNLIAQMALGDDRDTNAPAATEKVFAIESTALVSIALFGAFVGRAKVSFAFWDSQKLWVAVGLILGNFLPHVFSRTTTRSVGRAGLKMVLESRNGRANYIKFPTEEFLRGLIRPGALVMLAPVIVGTLFGADMLLGVLAGSLYSVLQIAVSQPNEPNRALNKAIKNIEDGALEYVTPLLSEEPDLQDVVDRVGFVGHRLKDTSSPALNILVQLMALESLVLAPFFASHGGLLLKFLLEGDQATSPL